MTDSSLDPILAYLREHSARYSLSALREQLVQTGHDPALVDRAITIYQQENPPPAAESVWPKALLVWMANILIVVIEVSASDTGVISSIVIACELPAGLLLARSPENRLWGRALVFGFLLTAVPVLLLVLVVGLCLKTLEP